jgi:hypothetical protein
MPLALFTLVGILLQLMGLPTALAMAFAALTGGLLAVYVVIYLSTITSGWFPSSMRTWLLAGVWAALIAVGAAAITTTWTGEFGPPSVVVGAAVGLTALRFVRRSATTSVTSESPLPWQVRTMSKTEADAAYAAARTRLDNPKLDRQHRAIYEIQLADAMRAQALHANSPDRLDDIIKILQPHAYADDLPHGTRLAAVCGLVEARSLMAEITRDDARWDDDLDREDEITDEPDAEPWERGRFLHDLGDRETYLVRGAHESGADPLQHAQAALTAFRDALAILGDDAPFAPMLRSKIAQQAFLVAMADRDGPYLVSSTQTVEELRQTLTLYRGRRRDGRELVELAIALLLVEESGEQGCVTDGLLEAESIGARLVRSRRAPEIAGSVHEMLAAAVQVRIAHSEDLPADRRGALRADHIEHLASAFRIQRRLSVATAAEPGRRWAEAVAAEGDVGAAADAYTELVRQVPLETLRLLKPHDRAAFVAGQQGVATEAGYWLAADGRLDEAVDAIEDARAILLGQRAGRVPDDLGLALAGRPDLHEEYVAAARELDEQERALYDAHADTGPVHEARSRYDRIRREIAQVTGGDTARPGRLAARTVAPTIYMGATDRTGYALAVGPDGTTTWAPLPHAGRPVLDVQLDRYRRFLTDGRWRCSPEGDDALAAVLGWVWDAVLAPLVSMLPPVNATVSLVPLGGLGLLPLHAAGRGDQVVDDVLTTAYAPSARMAARARLDARLAAQRPPMLLGVGVRDALEGAPLPLVNDEVRAIGKLAPAVELLDATRARTLTALGQATTWHFACHGEADPTDPLDSRLLVADGEISVRDILARSPGAYRLGVLSACETAAPDAARLDEMIGFPGALMQAGVAGVVASAWPVADRVAYAFAVRLHELLAADVEPATAVRRTRLWLRTVTRGQLHDHLGSLFAPPDGTPTRHLARWRDQQPYRSPRHWAAFALTGT